MQVSADGIKLIKKWEGCHDLKRNPGKITAYLCPAGVPTIGFGSTRYVDGRPVYYAKKGEQPPADTISMEEAESLLMHEVRKICEPTINRKVKVALAQPQYDALASFIFNVGSTNFANSTLLILLNSGDYQGAADQLLRWIHGGGRVLQGLVDRRQEERALFLTGETRRESLPIVVRGEKGDLVLKLQQALNAQGMHVVEDSIFGDATTKAVREFQTKSQLLSDGIVGPKTWEALLGRE